MHVLLRARLPGLTLADARAQWLGVLERVTPPVVNGKAKRQVDFVPVETLLRLAGMFVVEHTRYGSATAHQAPEPVPQMSRLFKRPPSSFLARMANLNGSRSHGATYDLLAGSVLRSAPERMADTYRLILTAARSVGIGPDPLPDFLHLGGTSRPLDLLGQEEISLAEVESVVEGVLREQVEDALEEADTLRVVTASVGVGPHRFASSVLSNCGSHTSSAVSPWATKPPDTAPRQPHQALAGRHQPGTPGRGQRTVRLPHTRRGLRRRAAEYPGRPERAALTTVDRGRRAQLRGRRSLRSRAPTLTHRAAR